MDTAIPIVFPDYVITVTTPATRVEIPDLFPGFDVLPDSVQIPKTRQGFSDLGHAGVLLINGSSGLTKYYEYGRYDRAALGIARRVPIPDVPAGGKASGKSLAGCLNAISIKAGHGSRISAAYVEAPGGFLAMHEYALRRISENKEATRRPYSLLSNSCVHFMRDVLIAGGVKTPSLVDPRPVSYIEELRAVFSKVDFSPPRHLMVQ